MRNLFYSVDARRDLADIALYIATESNSRETATRFVERLRAKCVHLATLSGTLGTARPELRADIRSTPCQGYIIFLRYHADNTIEIVNVLHGSRDVISYFDDGL